MPFYIYILTNRHNTTFYTGVTGDLKRRANQHKLKSTDGFTKRYNVNKLVYYEVFAHAMEDIAREKQIKAGSRQKKITLIRSLNRKFEDLTLKL